MTRNTPPRTPTEGDIGPHNVLIAGRLYTDIHRERIRANTKHHDKPGGSMEQKPHDDPDWLPVLVEEVGEVAKVICDHRHGLIPTYRYDHELRAELVQVAAMAAAWIDAIDHAPPPRTTAP